ncbi:hypothetical protein Mal15_07040 [Stieleria maiorica]|uniref:Secreted protein n=1 Tax=Stieleria maiorica TaxID=2795974 RepID=A0A5B9M917_9BACT|nr:DUF3784 domain-containing protein [Stieleria maiorica]QEF96676.1 hypothetical protein Mal15_07040 [Stieleria maiorica]
MTRSVPLLLCLVIAGFAVAGCGSSPTVDKPTGADATASGYDAMSDAEKAEYEKEMAKQMGQ